MEKKKFKEDFKEGISNIGDKVEEKAKSLWGKAKKVGQAFKREADETKIAIKILRKVIKGEEVSEEQIQFLKNQSVDLGKAMAVVGLQAIPGSSVAIVALEKLGQRHGFTVFPKDQVDPNMEEAKSETSGEI